MQSNDKIIVILVLVTGVITLFSMISFVGLGNVREVPLYYQEKVEQTVAFEEVNGEVQIVGVKGVKGEVNPTLLTRTSFAYILTIINNGTTQHRLYIEGFNVQTDLLEPGAKETLTIFPDKEGVYKYFDKRENLEHLGFLEVKTVVASDEFTGIWRDLI